MVRRLQRREVILLDDMDEDFLAHHLKIWTDKYSCTGEIKGGTVKLQHKWFIVTSNQEIDELFISKPEVMVKAIQRRFIEIEIDEQKDVIDQLTNLI